MKRTLDDILLHEDDSIMAAIERLQASSQQIVLVVDSAQHLVGTVTDGDVRRGILRRVPLEGPVSEVMNPAPATIPPDTPREQALRVMRERDHRHLPIIAADGRLIGLEVLEDLISAPGKTNWVVLMAGGEGSRLRPLTESVPKPLLDIGGRPILETLIENCRLQGFNTFYVSVNYRAEQITDHFGTGADRGVDIEYLRETSQLGTAGSLSLLPGPPAKPIVVMNADVLTSINLQRVLDFHDEHKAAATMCVREYDIEVPFGVVEIDGARLTGISEKPVHSFFVNAGIYVLGPEALSMVPAGERFDMPDLFERLIANGEETVAFPVREYWMDIGRLNDLEQAQRDFSRVFG